MIYQIEQVTGIENNVNRYQLDRRRNRVSDDPKVAWVTVGPPEYIGNPRPNNYNEYLVIYMPSLIRFNIGQIQ